MAPAFAKSALDLSLYLVTDSTPAILGDRNLVEVVEAALRGGVTCVQYRDKTSDTGDMVSMAQRLHHVTQQYGVPLLINDRVDVALAVGCEGVHVGQDDMDLLTARKLLGPDAIIGVSASTVEQAVKATNDGADYLGIGAVFSTATKTNTKNILGTAGLRNILTALPKPIKTVCIGGLNNTNIGRVIYQSSTADGRRVDGVAIVSAIVAAKDPEEASRHLHNLVVSDPKLGPPLREDPSKGAKKASEPADIIPLLADVVRAIGEKTPLSHNMTNLVVQNFAANVALAIGASPIMSLNGEEAPALAKLGGALVVNMGTATPQGLENHELAIKAYNQAGRPIVFDPVGAGATPIRRAAFARLLNAGYLNIIKGNAGEILTLLSASSPNAPQQRGVDSTVTQTADQLAAAARALAQRERCVVLLTGKTDYASDGTRTFAIDNGHELLSRVTGTGCVLGTCASAAAAAYPDDMLVAGIGAIVLLGLAGERAAARDDVRGPGTFAAALIDELDGLRRETLGGDLRWLKVVKVRKV